MPMVATAAMPLPTMVDITLLLMLLDTATAPMLLPPTLLTLTAPTAILPTDILTAAGILMLQAPAHMPLAIVLILPLTTTLMPLATAPMPLVTRPTGTGMFSTLSAPPSCTAALLATGHRGLDIAPITDVL